MKYIFVTGGVVSGLGKGITAASLGRLLKQRGLRRDDPEIRSLSQHRPRHDESLSARRGLRHRRRRGDGPGPRPLRALHRREPDPQLQRHHRQDLLDGPTTASAAATIWAAPVQVIPHITNEIKNRVYAPSARRDREVRHHRDRRHRGRHRESQPFLEAIRQVAAEVGQQETSSSSTCPLIVSIPGSGELKSKPTQHSRQGAALPRHPAGHPRLPHGQPAARRCAP